ncbi:MAG TPA: non-ribosomal peptide synthase/polyketide synthase [Thermoanaerobaculia bacterium]|nr:non-ribosomal peptide synthase/polyketide synthase [Thermoanaerobaculia bacterium]
MMQKTVSQGFRLSPQQEHVWWAQRAEHSSSFVVQARIDIAGTLDRQRLASALEAAVERHEILRTTFPLLPGLTVPVQSIEDSSGVRLSERSLAGLPAAEREPALDRLCAELRQVRFDLTNGPLLCATLIVLDDESHALLLSLPALAADGVSLDLLATEIAVAYHGTAADGEVFQYADLAELLHEWQGSPADDPGPAFWREQDLSALVRVTLGQAGFPNGEPFRPEHVRRRIGSAPIEEAAARLETTVSLILLAGWHAALHLSTGEEEIVVGTLFDGRTCEELESALGLFARYLPVRGRSAAGSTLEDLGRALSATVADVSRRQDFFSPEPVERLLKEHGASGWPFGFDYRRPRELPAAPGSPRFSIGDGHLGLDRFGLRLSILDDGRSLRADLAHDPVQFPREEAERLLERFSRVLDGLLAGTPLGEIDILSEAERQSVLLAFNRTEGASPADLCAHHLFEERVRLTPDAPALIHAGRSRTYAELNTRANQLAHHLRASGVSPGSLVGIRLERSPELVEAVLGVLKAGAAYVPLDPGYPAERLAFMAEDAGLSLLLADDWLADHRSEVSRQSEQDPPRSAGPADLAYVIYTSGSTGRPKGVMIPHRGLVNYLLWARQAYTAGEGSGAPVHSAIGFDLTVTSLLVPLAAGTAVTLLDERRSVEALVAALRDATGFSLVKLTPAHLDVLRRELRPEEHAGRSRALVIGGEALRGESVAPWREHAPDTRLINEYGPTEATVGCCVYEIAPGDPAAGPVPIGRPIANTRLYVVGPRLRPVPPGAPGELWIGGDGLARGYLGQPALTAERFVPDPFAAEMGREGERLYRTGDLVRLRPDGHLEFLGRIDGQLKIRGFRIEPGEIEAALAAHPQVREAVVVARENDGGKRLVAYVVPRSRDAKPAASELRRHLESRLPDYMVPAAFVGLDSLPLTPNGKLDRRALPDPGFQGREEAPYAPPRTLTEELLAEIWGRVLGVDRVGIDDHYFSLGGDSIHSLQILSLAQKRGLALTLQDLFQRPTIRALAEQVSLGEPRTEKTDAASEPFSLVKPADRAFLPGGLADAYPLARLQAGMLFHSEHSPESAIFNDQHSFHVRGELAPELLQSAIDGVVRRHAALRTSFDFTSFSEPLQLVHARVEAPAAINDLLGLDEEAQEAAVAGWLRADRHRSWDWSRAPLARFQVHRRSAGTFQFTLSFHHSILDGWSAASLLSELFRRYTLLLAGTVQPEEPAPTASYRDFVRQERIALTASQESGFWHRYLAGAEVAPVTRWRPAAGGARRARVVSVYLPEDTVAGLRALARTTAVPLKSVLLAAHCKVMGFLTGTADVLTGLSTNGRPEQADGEQVLGLFLNNVPFRQRLGGETWEDLSQAVFANEREILPHRRFPLADIQTAHGGRPLFEAAFNFLHYHVYKGLSDIDGVEVLGRAGYEETNFPLVANFSLDPQGTAIALLLNFSESQLAPAQAEAIAGAYLRALAAMAAEPGRRHEEVSLLSEAERHLRLYEWNPAEVAAPGHDPAGIPAAIVHERIRAQALRTPDAPAVLYAGQSLSYAELQAAANRLARRLRRLGVGPDTPVAVALDRSLDLPVALLAVLAAGGAYLPLDGGQPQERLARMLEGAGARFLVTHPRFPGRLPPLAGQTVVDLERDREALAAEPPDLPAAAVAADHLAYVLYTSGSTGAPKGVMVPHRGLANYLDWASGAYPVREGRGAPVHSSVGFDLTVTSLFLPLVTGGCVDLLPEDGELDGLAAALTSGGFGLVKLTPSHLNALAGRVPAEAVAAATRSLVVGGEALFGGMLRGWEGPRIFNEYGPTETVVGCSVFEQPAGLPPAERVPIGRPVANTRLLLLAADLQPVPLGAPGEIWVAGVQVARGYLNRPDLTAERFLPDPSGVEPGARAYRTGDHACHRPDGVLDYLGRTDSQVKVRGHRIELGEIEAVLAACPAVAQAAVALHGGAIGEERLVAYVALRGSYGWADLRSWLAARLPEPMIPAEMVELPALPLTPNGKVDRAALPAPDAGRPPRESTRVAPRGPVEEVLAAIWAEVLHVDRVGAEDDFFELGGNSITSLQISTRARRAGLPLNSRVVLQYPTVAALAAHTVDALRSGAQQEMPPLEPAPRDPAPPLSFAQQRLWFIDQLEPGSPLYNIATALRVEGPLDGAVLALCLGEIVRRHEALRTVFVSTEGSPVQVIQPAEPFRLAVVDLSELPEREREALALRLAREEAARPFDLTRGPLFRGVLLRLACEDHVAALTMHHIVSDGWSLGILVHELAALYPAFASRRPSPLPELPVQYTDFSAWQRSWLRGEALESEISFWRRQLAGLPPRLELPTDRPRPAEQSFRGASRRAWLPAELIRQVEALGRREGATLFMVLLAGFQILLSRFSGQQDLAVGTPVAGRNRVEVEGLIGFFVNTLVLRGDLTGEPSFRELLDRVRETALAAYLHQDLPFEKLVEELAPERSLSHSPLFQVMLALQNAPAERLEIQDLRLRRAGGGGRTAKFDLTLSLAEHDGALVGALEHATDLFDATTVDRLMSRYERLLAEALAMPDRRVSELPLLGEAERHQTLVEWNDTLEDWGVPPLLPSLVAAQAARTPERIAVEQGDRALTAGELEARANRLARLLLRRGVRPEDRVALCCDRSPEMVVSLLAVWKAGAAWVPLDPAYPAARLAAMLEDARPAVLIAGPGAPAELLQGENVLDLSSAAAELAGSPGEDAGPPRIAITPDHLAYAIYTSGSTGRPKGVLVAHGAIANRLLWMRRFVGPLGETDAVLQKTPYVFDASIWEIFLPLLTGARLVLASPGAHREPAAMAREIRERGVTVLQLVPSMLGPFLDEEQSGSVLRRLFCGGEALPAPLCERVFERLPGVELCNLYGPTECAIDVTFHPFRPGGGLEEKVAALGRPLDNVQARILDRWQQPVPLGQPGELCAGGAGLARGYLGRPDLTAERFVPDPCAAAPGARLYRTGDLVRQRPDGTIHFLGRIDHQVKIRGFRIELGEIEAALTLQPEVSAAVVVARQDGPSPRLVAYVVPGEGEEPSPAALREALLARLPDYMIPAAWVVLPSLPLTATGKVDRRALPAPEPPTGGPAGAGPNSPIERMLAAIWAQVLRLDRVGIHDNFFELGGDSILSIQVCARAMKAGIRISPRLLFQHQTVAELAAVANTLGAVEAEQGLVTGPVPLTPIQRWFFAPDPAEPHHFNQAVLFETARRFDPAPLAGALDRIERHHDALRLRFSRGEAGWRQTGGLAGGSVPLTWVDLAALPAPARPQAVRAAAAEAQASLDLEHGPLHRALLLDLGPREPGRFFWAIHHLAVDGVSWRFLLEDLATLYDGFAQGHGAELPAKTTSFRYWAERLAGHTGAPETEAELSYWLSQPWTAAPRLPLDRPSGVEDNTVASAGSVSLSLDAEETRALLQEVPQAYNTRINDVLLTALARGFHDWSGSPVLLVDLEGHGREEVFPDADLSRTVGWFTSIYPMLLDLREAPDPGASLKAVKEQLRRVPRGGLGYGLLRQDGRHAAALAALPRPEVVFNYLGQLDQALPEGSPFRPAREPAGPPVSPLAARRHLLELNGGVFGGRLGFTCTFSTGVHRRETVQRLVDAVAARLRELIDHCRAPEAGGYTPSDFPLAGLDQIQLDTLAGPPIEDIYPLSPLQNGMLFHSLMAPGSGVYIGQFTSALPADLDSRLFRQAWERLIGRHGALRTVFLWDGLHEPRQAVHKSCALPWQDLDWRDLPADEQQRRFEELRYCDRHTPLPLTQAPLMRFSLIRLDRELAFIWTFHHLLIDGWSIPVLVQELGSIYAALREGREPALPPARPFSDYIAWLLRQDQSRAEPFWREELAGFTAPNSLGIDHAAEAHGASGYSEQRIRVSREVTAELQALAARHRLTLQTVTLGAWALLVSRYSSEEDVVFGSVVSGRPAALPGVETMIGMLINTLPVRVRVDDAEPLVPWLHRLQESQLARQEFEHSPLTQIQRWSEVPAGSQMFETIYVFENYPAAGDGDGGSGGLRISRLRSFENTHYPIALLLAAADQISLRLTYDRARIDEDAVPRLLQHLATLLEGMAGGPERRIGELGLLTAEEALQLRAWNETATAYPLDRPLHAWIEERASLSPEAVAIVFETEKLTYRELNRRANRLARRLHAHGCAPESRVGVLLERSCELLVALLGILKAGAAYVPLDPDHPADRLAFQERDARLRLILTRSDLAGRLPGAEERFLFLEHGGPADGDPADDSFSVPVDPDHPAYVLYTSGSTGRPKGAVISHRAIANRLLWMQEALRLSPADRVLQKTPFSFDVSVWELFWPLMTGACLVVARPGGHRDNPYLVRLIAEQGITVLHFVPSMLQLFLEEPGAEKCCTLRDVVCSGEALPAELARRFAARLGHARLHNLYGPTEAAVDVTSWTCDATSTGSDRGSIPIGRPIANTRIHLLGPGLLPVPVGVPGELFIAGVNLARGYVERPDLTAERFLPAPAGGEPGERVYRTGDLARWRDNGALEFLGRTDHQVKIRGFRIELGEIEAVLLTLPGVREAVVLAREDRAGTGSGDRRLVAYTVGDATADALRQGLRERLPEHMVPAAFVALAALPLTPSGKADRKALPAPEWQSAAEGHLAPRTPVEDVLAGIWAEILGLERVGAADNFFNLGGHSLLATRVMSRLRGAFGVEVPLREIFEAPVLADLAARVETALRAGASPLAPPLVPVPREGPLPLSFAQQRLWFIDQLEPGSPLYNIPAALRVQGPLRSGVLALCLGEIVRRHETLRTVFAATEGSPVQVIHKATPFRLPVIDLSGLPERERESLALTLSGGEAARPFDLTRGSLLRATLLRLADEDQVVLLTVHHIVSDGWSMGILVRELTALYPALAEGRPSPLPELPVQYADFAAWQASWLHGETLENEISFWRRHLAGLPPHLELPTDRPRPAAQSFRGAIRHLRLPAELTRQAQALGRREGATLFMVLLTGFQALLARYSGQQDLAVGSPVAGRNRIETENLIGFFVNTLVLRGDLTGEPSFRELLGRVRETSLAAHSHQDVPFEKLVQELSPERSLSRTPLFQAVLALQNAPVEALEIRDLHLRPVSRPTVTAKFDLTFNLAEHGGGLSGAVEYATDLFDSATIDRLILQYGRLLAEALAKPEREIAGLPLLPAAERHQMLVEWNDTAAARGEETLIHHPFEAWARRTPDAAALVWRGETLTYGALEERANRLAHHLAHLGAGPGSLIGIHLRRGPDLIVAVLAILKAGAAYVPLEIGHPPARLRLILDTLEISCLMTETAQQDSLPALPHVICLDQLESVGSIGPVRPIPPRRASPDDLAYIIFTSGSTGTPKGVMVRHRPVINLLRWAYRAFAFSPADRVLFVTSLSFDLSVFDIFGLLGAGGSIRIADEEEIREPERLLQALVEEPITFWDSAPAALEQTVPFLAPVLDRLDPQARPALRLVFLSGDWIPVTLPGRIRERFPEARVVALGGATEATVWSNVFPVLRVEPSWTSIPYGRPIENARYHVLDVQLAPCPVGVPGDLYIGGDCLADGYAREPVLTAHKFVPDPWGATPGGRLYRTGDRARYRPDGNLEFLGRLDHQVKIRGFRIELGEIEAALATLPGVREAAVVVREDRSEEGGRDRRLVAYVAGDAAADALRQSLRERLPDYMVPAAFVTLAALPLTANGKVDRKALPAPEWQGSEEDYLAPRTPVEEILAGIWAELLGLERVGAADHFFELGGHSLLATQVTSRLRGAFGVEIPLRTLFEAPTLAELAERVETARRAGAGPMAPPLVPVLREGPLPLSFAQQRLWFLHQMDPRSPVYNMPFSFRLSGLLAIPALAASLTEVVRRHETLRTTLVLSGNGPVQSIAPPARQPLPRVDLSALPVEVREETALRLGVEEARRPFDLARPPVVRTLLLRLAEREHVLLFTIHHVSGDGWSVDVLSRELVELYGAAVEGRPARLPELPVQYADFAVWQRSWLQGAALTAQIDYWRHRLAGAPALLELPLDRPRPPVQSFRGRRCRLRLPAGLRESLLRLGRTQGATGFMTLLAGFQALLHRYSGQESVVVGTPIANRDRAELERLIGFFANTLALRADFAGDPGFAELLLRVRETALGAYVHQDLPFEKLVDELSPQRDMSYAPVFQVLFIYQNAVRQGTALRDLSLRPFGTDEGVARFDLTLSCIEIASGLAVDLDSNADLFEEATAERMLRLFSHLLAQMAAEPQRPIGELALLDEEEHRQVVLACNRTARARAGEELSLHALFERQAALTPESPAVVGDDGVVSYGELAGWAGRIAERLRRLGLGAEDRVGVCLERSAAALAALLGTLKAGAAYVPLDPEWPRERLAAVAADAGLAALLTRSDLAAAAGLAPREVLVEEARWGTPGELPRAQPVTPEAAAYVVYTSGSSGAPKGVVTSHRAAANFVLALGETLGLAPGDRLLLFAPLSFDASVLQIFPALSRGAAVVVHPDPRELAGAGLPGFCERHGVTVLDLPAALWRQWIEDMAAAGHALPVGIRAFLTGGESVPAARVRAWAGLTRGRAAFLSSYGPTEATVTATVFQTDSAAAVSLPEGKVPIGHPLANVRAYVLDARMRLVPKGVAGELYLAGDGLARGYLGQPGLTASSFVPDAAGDTPGGRLYRTGDLARRLPGGDLEFLGRADTQVKLRGFRLELSEVEAVLGRHPDLAECVATVREDRPEDRRLVAYVVPQPGRAPDLSELRSFVAERLPDFMVPAAFVTLAALPLTPSGKVDRKALPAPEWQTPEETWLAPRTPAEEALAGIWAELLGLQRVGAVDNFFDLGGHSLLATQARSRVRESFGVELPLRTFFERPMLADLAAEIEALRSAGGAPRRMPIERADHHGPLPLSVNQQRFWFLQQLNPASSAFNLSGAARLSGRLDGAALEASFGEIVRRHSTVRTRIVSVAGVPHQIIDPPGSFTLFRMDLSGLAASVRDGELRRVARSAANRPFDLAGEPPLQVLLLRLADDDHALLFSLHHTAGDGWSMDVLTRELGDLYEACIEGRPSPLAELPIQYADWVVAQQEWLRGPGGAEQLAYWRRKLGGDLPVLTLPGQRQRPPVRRFRGSWQPLILGASLSAALADLSRSTGSTLFMCLLAAFKALLHLVTGAEDLLVGTHVANREGSGTEGLIGLFVNDLALRTDLSGRPSFRELLARVRETALEAYAHQDLPFEALQADLRPDRSAGPLFQVLFVLQNAPGRARELPGLSLASFPAERRTANFDLTLSLTEEANGVSGAFAYDVDLFEESTIARLAEHFVALLREVVSDPDRPLSSLSFVSPAAAREMADSFSEDL